jgi:hypothetical protein
MNANIFVPIFALILTSGNPVTAFRNMMNITVATTVATVVHSAAMKVNVATGNAAHLEYSESGVRKIMTNSRTVPVKKRANIH